MNNIKPRISVDYREGVTVVSLMDEKILDMVDIQSLEDSIMPVIEQMKGIRLLLDFSNVKFLSSSMLGVLIRISKRIYEGGGKLGLSGINPKIYEIFKITRLNKIFDIYEDSDKALNSLSGQGKG